MITTGRTISPRPLTAQEKRAVIAMQAHLRCEDLLSGKATSGRMDRRTVEGLKVYQHLQMLADNGNIDLETRTALLGDSREQDFRALLRALRARVVDVTGLIEDGSALGAQGEVEGRVIDTAEFRPLVGPPAPGKGGAPPAGAAPTAAAASPPSAAEPSSKDGPVKIVAAPDLIAAATQAASEALGWKSPEAVLASTLVAPPPASKRPGRKTAQDQGAGAAAGSRRDPFAAGAGVPRPQHGAARRDRPRRGGPGPAQARQGRTQDVEAAGGRPSDHHALRARGRSRRGALPVADHHRRLEDVREVRRHHGPQVQGVGHRAMRCGPRCWPRRPGTRRRACPPAIC